MKNNKKTFITGLILAFAAFTACSDEFLDRPPKDALVDASFYQTDEQVLAGSAPLYNIVWAQYNETAAYSLGDYRGGAAYQAYNDQDSRDHVEFNATPNTKQVGEAWRAFYNVVGQSNTLIQNINTYAGEAVSDETKAHAIAEARFMRGLAYQYLVMNYGAVPIITNNLTLLSDTTQPRHTVESVWKFVTREFRVAADVLPETPIQPGRLTQWSAEAMLARTYLIRAGVGSSGGTRNQVFLDSAKYYSRRVIELSGARLLENYAHLFMFPYDNNPESLFSLQWVYSGPDAFGTANRMPSFITYSNDIANDDGWGGDKAASMWVLSLYDGFENVGDTLLRGNTLDQRLKATFMLPGMVYPEITQTATDANGNPIEQDLVYPETRGGDAESVGFAAIKKYVTGKAKDVGGQSATAAYGHDTYMIRLAEMYLIYAEAALGNAASTTDATILDYFNAVHTRAGLPPVEELTWRDIFEERIVEFAMEGRSWYDIVALHYYNPDLAYEIISQQDRGLYYVEPDRFPNPTSWTIGEVSWDDNRHFNANSGNFMLPIPAAELSQAPNLAKPPVEYDFED